MHRFSPLYLLFSVLGAIVLLFIIAPLIGMLLSTTSAEIFDTVRDSEVTKSIWLTIGTSILATIVFAFFSIPLAYLLARKRFIFKQVILGIINLPVVIPHTAAGIALLGFISRDTLLGKTAEQFGLTFIGHPLGISLAMAFVSIPFLINSCIDGFASVPERLEKSALTLGASPMKVFFTISLPLAWRNIVTGFIMMFSRGMSEFGAVVIIAYHPMITPVLIYERFGDFGLKYARPVAILFIAVCLVFFIVLRILAGEKKFYK